MSPVLDSYQIPTTTYYPSIEDGAYGTGVYQASASDPAVTVTGYDGTASTLWNTDAQVTQNVTIPHWPANAVPASGTDGHIQIVDTTTGILHSFWQLVKKNGVWTSHQYSWTPITGSGFGTPAQIYAGNTATGTPTAAGLIRKAEIDDGDTMYRHALGMSLDYSALSASTPYVFPATAADTDASSTNYGMIPEGSLVMLPSTFDTSTITSAKLKKVAETLKVYGARIMDRNVGTRFAISAEQGSGYTLYPNGWDNKTAADLQTIASALRMVKSTSGWIDANGTAFTPSQNLNLLSMRGPWRTLTGAGTGAYDTYSNAVTFTSSSVNTTAISDSPNSFGKLAWAAGLTIGKSYTLTGKGTGGAKMKLRMYTPSGGTLSDTAFVGDGESITVTIPSNFGWASVMAQAGASGASTIGATLLAK